MLATPLFLLFQADLTFRIDTVEVNGSSPFGPTKTWLTGTYTTKAPLRCGSKRSAPADEQPCHALTKWLGLRGKARPEPPYCCQQTSAETDSCARCAAWRRWRGASQSDFGIALMAPRVRETPGNLHSAPISVRRSRAGQQLRSALPPLLADSGQRGAFPPWHPTSERCLQSIGVNDLSAS
jgi:hypothetical protein